jgi:ubiquinone/menaquinone biosynthesis C-methylase UbiE
MSGRGWDEIAEWYDAKQGEDGDLWHRYIIDPCVLDVVGPVRGLRVLDLACGNGYLSRRFAREGAAEVVGVDGSAPVIELARGRERARPLGVRYEVRDASRLEGFDDGVFDLVLSNMAIMDIEDAAGALREAGRVTRPGGRIVLSLCHPCFDLNERSMWVVERAPVPVEGRFRNTVWRKVNRYRTEEEQHGWWVLAAGEVHFTKGYHRTLSTYSRYLRAAGYAIVRMEEPMPQPTAVAESPQGEFMTEIPLHLVLEAVRLPADATGSGPIRPG